jgi:biopolymer transport protein ExbB/TolQ
MNITERINHGLDWAGAEWIMWLLLLLSVLTLACILERGLFLISRKLDLETTWSKLAGLLDNADGDLISDQLQNARSMEEVVGLSVLQERGRSAEALEDIAQAAVTAEKLKYSRGLRFLATITSNAPFIGLLGTVVGIVQAFAKLAEVAPGAGRSSFIMGSISEALAATAIGLLVAIPAAAAYNWFQGKVDDCESRSLILSRRLIAKLR